MLDLASAFEIVFMVLFGHLDRAFCSELFFERCEWSIVRTLYGPIDWSWWRSRRRPWLRRKLRRRKTDKSVSLDETIDTGEDTVVREIAAWGEDPEQSFSREELGSILDTAIESLEPLYRSVFVLRDIEEL